MQWFNVGKIVNTHGIKGEVRVISTTDFPEQRFQIGNILHVFTNNDETGQPLTIKTHRRHKNFELLSFENMSSVSDVEKLKGGLLKVSAEQRKNDELADGEFHSTDIIGCTVLSEDGKKIGHVTDVLSPGANDVFVVQNEQQKSIYIPNIDLVVKKINLSKKQIVIHIMEGLIE